MIMVVLGFACALTQASEVRSQPPTPDLSPEDEVLANLRSQKIGRHSLADLNLPEAFLRREADRIIRASFEERYRVVVRDEQAVTEDGHAAAPPIVRAPQAHAQAIDLFEPPLSAEMLAYRTSFAKGRPSNRGFMPALVVDSEPWPMHEPDESASPELIAASDIVGRRLASDGLLATTVNVVQALGSERFTSIEDDDRAVLRQAGLPFDLLQHFHLEQSVSGEAIISFAARSLAQGQSIVDVIEQVQRAEFAFQPTRPGLQLVDDAGSLQPGVARAQVTRGGYWRGVGDGATTDLVRQAVAALPNVNWFLSVHAPQAREFAEMAATWPSLGRPDQLTLVIESLEVQQWTQDNAKAALIDESKRALIVPRYASWGDDGSTFVPGEMFLLPGVAQAMNAELVHSPLLFQGGNILCVWNPASGDRLLLISEADVYRNTTLGLTAEQVLEAFRAEFGCDRCEMLPSISFHLDFDVSVRAHDGRLIAFVNDAESAAQVVLECGTQALARAGLLSAEAASPAIELLRKGESRAFIERVGPVVYGKGSAGRFPLSLAERFAVSPMDSGVGNLHRFLLAMDFVAATYLQPHEMPTSRHARSYLQSMRRRENDWQALHERLRELGMDVRPVPCMSETTRGFAYLNSIHTESKFLVSTYGGLYEPLDRAVLEILHEVLGESIELVPIECSESQRRSGAVRCSISLFPANLVGAANTSP